MQTLPQLKSGQLLGTKHLKLSSNLTEFPLEILDLADSLEILDLSGNKLTHLPEEFAKLKKLRIAFFSDNDFTAFPAVLGQCPQLEMIGFKACRIKQIPEGALPVLLRWLILTNNQLTQLPTSIGTCTRLQKLMLAGNKLKSLPDSLQNCQNLELLRISANQLSELPKWVFLLPRLAWLAFSGNPFSFHRQADGYLHQIPWADLKLGDLLGQGASGLISRAQWHAQAEEAKTVAVKVFKGEVTSDGLPEDEMKACLAAGDHPHLVSLLGKISQHPEQKQGLVFDLIPAGYRNLGGPPSFETCTRDTFPEGTTFKASEIYRIVSGVASVAAHLHAKGILHGDLYAHNTLVNEAGHALFTDFGAATLYDATDLHTAAMLEKLEARAFGCLLDDLLQHLNPTDGNLPLSLALTNLAADCLQPEFEKRPSFSPMVEKLAKLKTAV